MSKKMSLYDKQNFCERKGYLVRAEPEGKLFRMKLYKDGVLIKSAELVSAAKLPEAYKEKYEAMYKYLTDAKA